MTEDYDSMTVAQLKEALKEMGLPVSGKKSDLLARLQEAAGQADDASKRRLLLRKPPMTMPGTTKTGTMKAKTSTWSSKSPFSMTR